MSTMRDAPILKAVADVIKAHVGKALGSALTRINAVEGRLNDLPAWFGKDFELPKGEQGPAGNSGLAGAPGEPGQKGLDGKDGAPGIRGDAGIDGKEGPQGVRGEIGPLGPIGERGERGSAGAPGRDGADGALGEKGLDGAAGKDGKDGADGLSIKGDAGERGQDGAQGASGDKGDPGLAGKDGSNGIDGKDAPPIDTKALTGEIVEKVLDQIPAPVHGKDGRDGKDAEQLDVNDLVSKILGQIPPPIPGKDGKDVDAEALNVRIASEVSKAIAALPKPAAGRDGRDGRAGEPGESGKDAAEYDILNGMDESVSYQRGVYVKHRNGIFRAYRTTDPVIDKNYEAAGWMCMQSNIVDIVESLAPDQRTVIKTHEFSDGSIITSKHKSTALLDRGVWKEATEYEQGDSVTVAGSLWIAQEITQDRPGTSKAWRLAVKRGSDGKDLRPRDENDPPLNGKGSVYLGAKR